MLRRKVKMFVYIGDSSTLNKMKHDELLTPLKTQKFSGRYQCLSFLCFVIPRYLLLISNTIFGSLKSVFSGQFLHIIDIISHPCNHQSSNFSAPSELHVLVLIIHLKNFLSKNRPAFLSVFVRNKME